MPSPGRLAPQARPQALAELEARIAQAEKIRNRHYGAVSRLVAAGQDSKGARTMLKFAEQCLAQLQRSREVLISGERPGHDEAEAAAP
jgi:DNA repair ATPase RecN